MKKKEVNINEESTSAGGAHAVNKFRISDYPLRQLRITFPACSSEIHFRQYRSNVQERLLLAQRHHLRCLQEGVCRQLHDLFHDLLGDRYRDLHGSGNAGMYLCRLSSL